MDIFTIILIVIFLIALFFAFKLGQKIGSFKRDRYWEAELPNHRKDAILKSRAVLGGYFSEQLAPFFPNFNFNPNECRFIGKPIDFLVFKGLDNKEIDEIVFVEVKSGKSKLSTTEKNLKKAVKDKKVRWEEYRVPEKVTDFKGIED